MDSHIQLEQTPHGYIQLHPGWAWKPCGHPPRDNSALKDNTARGCFGVWIPVIFTDSFAAIVMKDNKQEGGDQGCQILKELTPSSHHTAKSATAEPKTGLSSFILPALVICSTKIPSEDNTFILSNNNARKITLLHVFLCSLKAGQCIESFQGWISYFFRNNSFTQCRLNQWKT